MRYRTYWAGLLLGIAAGAIPAAIAARSGADAFFNGGIAAAGATCGACHEFNLGGGRVELLGLPRRYRPGATYDLSLRIVDPQQEGAGFEVSAENLGGHRGTFVLSDPGFTAFSIGTGTDYVTHTRDGVADSVAHWDANGGSYAYHLSWQAPALDEGSITFFAAGNAINDGTANQGDRYYAATRTVHFGLPGDADGDRDVDLVDAAFLQRCFEDAPPHDEACDHLDLTADNIVTLDDLDAWNGVVSGPTATLPAGFLLAELIRGARLYDRWWLEAGVSEPSGDHPLYPEAGTQTGSITYRCKECHGWDYEGVDGQYGSGSHFTGIAGVLGSTKTPKQVFDLLAADPAVTPDGHDMLSYGLSEGDLWDLTAFINAGPIDTSGYIAGTTFLGDEGLGTFMYYSSCSYCHGDDGKRVNFGTVSSPEYVGTVAVNNPWEFLHKVRFGHPASSMPAADLLGWPIQSAADVGKFCQTLPTN